MEAEATEALSALVDGEPVDATVLADALAQPGAHEALRDFVRLRAALAAGDGPPQAFVEGTRLLLHRRGRHASVPRPVRLMAAAAVVVLALMGALDLRRIVRPDAADQPPPAARVIRFEPGVDWHFQEVR